MKKRTIAIVCAAFALTASAQVRWGIEAGVNAVNGIGYSQVRIGAQVGPTVEYGFADHWSVDGSLKLSYLPVGNKNRWDFYDQERALARKPGRHHHSALFHQFSLTLPIRANYRFALSDKMQMSIGIGPALGFGLFGKGRSKSVYIPENTIEATSVDYDGHGNLYAGKYPFEGNYGTRLQVGGNIRLGLEISQRYTVGVEYTALWNTKKHCYTSGVQYGSLNVGYKF